jgi:hypothetical protein
MSWTADDLIGLRIKGSPSDRNRTVSRGELSTHGVPLDPRVLRNEPTPTTDPGSPLVLRIQRRLESPNIWNGRHWRVKHRISKDWELAIGHCAADAFVAEHGSIDFPNALGAILGPKKWIGYVAPKMRVTVERHVPSGRNFIRDDDNLRFCVKPLLDAFKRQGYIKNDSRKWLEHPTPTQHVSADGLDWTVITIQPATD